MSTGSVAWPATSPRTTVSRAVVRPDPGAPYSPRLPSVGDHVNGTVRCRSGSSARPTGTPSPDTAGGRSSVLRRPGSGSGHGRRGDGRRSRAAASTAAALSRSRSVGSGLSAADRTGCGPSPGSWPNRKGRTVTVPAVAGPADTVAPWNGTRSPGPRRTSPRPGRSRPIAAAAGSPSTSVESARSVTLRATRMSVFARMASVTTPAGRWVASTRWMPRLRPLAAMSTREPTNRGRSRDRAASSSTTINILGSRPPRVRKRSMSGAPRVRSSRSRWRSSARGTAAPDRPGRRRGR